MARIPLPDPKFAAGDVVVLNSGGPKMTVIEAMSTRIRVAWIDDDDNLEGAWFPNECVFRADTSGDVGVA